MNILSKILDFFFPDDSPEHKGEIGEDIVKKATRKRIMSYSREIHDFNMNEENGTKCQIDHIILRENGIFVIETKNYSGMIFGTEEQKYWTQVLSYGKVKNHFYSPVRQNRRHIYKLKEILGDDAPLFSVVVFTNGDISNIKSSEVFNVDEMKNRIYQNNDRLLDIEQIEKYYSILLRHNI